MKNKPLYVAQAGVIAAMYVVLTLISNAFGLANGAIQVRISEALCILPCFMPAAIPGLFVGCIISNILTGAIVWDIVFGSIATLIGAIGTRMLREKRFLAVLPPIVSNTIIVPFILVYAYNIQGSLPLFMLTVGIGEIISVGVFGEILYKPAKNITSIWENK